MNVSMFVWSLCICVWFTEIVQVNSMCVFINFLIIMIPELYYQSLVDFAGKF